MEKVFEKKVTNLFIFFPDPSNNKKDTSFIKTFQKDEQHFLFPLSHQFKKELIFNFVLNKTLSNH